MNRIITIGISFLLILSACNAKVENKNVSSDSLVTESAVQQLPYSFYKKLEGIIGDNIKVTMDLNKTDSAFSGNYYPDNENVTYGVYGQLIKANEIKLEARNQKNEMLGELVGRFTLDAVFEGTWTNLKTKQKTPCRLEEVKNEIANISFEHLRKENCNANKTDPDQRCSYIDLNVLNVRLTNAEVSEKINRSIIYRIIDTTYKTIDEMLITMNFDQEYCNWNQTSFTVETLEKDFISLECLNHVYYGGNHPESMLSYINFNLNDGSEIKLDQLLVPGYASKLNRIAEKLFVETNGTEGYSFQPGEFELNDNFSIKRNGLNFYFNSYEIGTRFSTGSVFIPYSDIKDLILPEGLLFKLLQK